MTHGVRGTPYPGLVRTSVNRLAVAFQRAARGRRLGPYHPVRCRSSMAPLACSARAAGICGHPLPGWPFHAACRAPCSARRVEWTLQGRGRVAPGEGRGMLFLPWTPPGNPARHLPSPPRDGVALPIDNTPRFRERERFPAPRGPRDSTAPSAPCAFRSFAIGIPAPGHQAQADAIMLLMIDQRKVLERLACGGTGHGRCGAYASVNDRQLGTGPAPFTANCVRNL